MNLEELHWFVVLAETEHMTDAAAELRITQPTLSRALARLEDQVGTKLFDRVHRRLRLNAYGQIMLEHARRSIFEINSATERIAALRDPDSGTVRLALLHSLASWLVPDLLRRFRSTAPRVQFTLSQAAAYEIVEFLAGGHVDLAITAPRPDRAGFGWHQLQIERLCLVVPRDHRFAKRARLRLAEAADEPFIALGEELAMRHLTDQLWAAEGISPRVVFEATEIPTMEGLVAAGLGVAVVPMPLPPRGEPMASYIPLSNPHAKRSVGLAWLDGRPLSPAADRFARFLKDSKHASGIST
jgi:LysR family transcriptional activator of glutamate synthase operon